MSDLLDVFAKAVRKALGPLNDEEQPVVALVAGLRADRDRLRGALKTIAAYRLDDFAGPCTMAMQCVQDAKDALGGAADQPSAVPDFKTWREHELRYVCEAMRDISRQNGEAARESANDVLAWAENRLRAADNGTEGHMEKRNAD